MASTTRIPKTEIDGLYGGMVKIFSRKMLGEVPEPAEVMWHNPTVFKNVYGLSHKAEKKWTACDRNLKSLAHMAVAALVGCSWCLDLGYFLAQNEDLDPAKAREVPRWRDSSVFTQVERDVLEYAEAMSLTPPAVTDEMVGQLLEALGPSALVELTTWIGLSNLYTRGNVAMGIESQGFSKECAVPLAQPSRATRTA